MEPRLVVPAPPPRQLLFRWLLPAFWVAVCLFGYLHPGEAYRLFLLGALAGIWVLFVLPEPASADGLLPPLLAGGAAVMLLFGWMLDRLRAGPWLWAGSLVVAAAVAGYVLLQGYADFEDALQRQGSFLAFAACALQLGGYAATVVAMGSGAFRLRSEAG